MDATVDRFDDAPATLRPLGLGGILAATLRIYRDNYLTFFLILTAYTVPVAAVSAARRAYPDLDWAWGLLSLLSSFMAVLGGAATIWAAAEAHTGHRSGVVTAYRRAFDRLESLIGLGFLFGLVVVGLAITVIGIPVAIYFLVRWSMAMCAVMIEGEGARSALSRSTDLVRGSWWRVFGILLVLGVVALARTVLDWGGPGGTIAVILANATSSPVLHEVAFVIPWGSLLFVLVGAFAGIGQTVLYYDLWERHYDLAERQAAEPSLVFVEDADEEGAD